MHGWSSSLWNLSSLLPAEIEMPMQRCWSAGGRFRTHNIRTTSCGCLRPTLVGRSRWAAAVIMMLKRIPSGRCSRCQGGGSWATWCSFRTAGCWSSTAPWMAPQAGEMPPSRVWSLWCSIPGPGTSKFRRLPPRPACTIPLQICFPTVVFLLQVLIDQLASLSLQSTVSHSCDS